MSRRTSAALFVGSLVLLCWGSLTAALSPGESPAWWSIATHLAPAASFLFVGLLVWARRPANGIGPLMMLVGVAWLVPWVVFYRAPAAYTVANVAESLYQPFLGHVALAFPTGGLKTRFDRAIVFVLYAWWVINNLVWAFYWDPVGDGATRPWERNVLQIGHSEHIHDLIGTIQFPVSMVMISLTIVALIWHWRTATPAGRRAMAPMIWTLVPTGAFVFLQEIGADGHLPDSVARVVFSYGPLLMASLPIGILIGLIRTRLSRGMVSELVRELSEAPAPGKLREALARAMHDPSVELVFRRGDGYVDAAGQPVALPQTGWGRAVTRLESEGRALGALIYDEVLVEEPEVVAGVGAAVLLALENERLQAEVRAQLEEVRASRARILQAGDLERQRIERNLHDGAQQRLLTLSLALRMAESQAESANDQEVRTTLEGAIDEVKHALQDLRELAGGLHPMALTRGGLSAAVRGLAERAAIPVEILGLPEGRLAPDVEAAAYYVVSEALANATKYSGAGRAVVDVQRSDGVLRVEVSDDGVGGADPGRGSGLVGLADRVAVLGGSLRIDSPPSHGTRIVAEMPCGS